MFSAELTVPPHAAGVDGTFAYLTTLDRFNKRGILIDTCTCAKTICFYT